jgi:CBS-domain-containing membrane protein
MHRHTKVKEIMTTPVIHAEVDTSVGEVASLLARHHISAVPITDSGGFVVGLVSEHDLLAKQGQTAKDIMVSSVISVTEDTDVEDVRVLLVDRRIRRVPVMAGQQLVGIVSRSDLVGLMALEWNCQVCGEIVRGADPPEKCPKCGSGQQSFVQQVPSPGG